MKAFFLSLLSFTGVVLCWNNGQGRTPPMGWRADFAYNCATLTEEAIKNTSAFMVNNGIASAGYNYINLGECWMSEKREVNGSLIADPLRFPNGIAGLANNLTAAGLKLGLAQSAGTTTCTT